MSSEFKIQSGGPFSRKYKIWENEQAIYTVSHNIKYYYTEAVYELGCRMAKVVTGIKINSNTFLDPKINIRFRALLLKEVVEATELIARCMDGAVADLFEENHNPCLDYSYEDQQMQALYGQC